jgi:hypothetical protein
MPLVTTVMVTAMITVVVMVTAMITVVVMVTTVIAMAVIASPPSSHQSEFLLIQLYG